MIQRLFANIIAKQLSVNNKVIVLYGARQIGKTTMLKSLKTNKKTLWINGDLKRNQDILSQNDLTVIKDFIDDNELLIIDEAQNIPNIGLVLKILYDEFPNIQIIATGSSAIELASETKEPLTGRSKTFQMYPISLMELRKTKSIIDIKDELPMYLKYGMYPEILMLKGSESKQAHLQELVSAYLYKDILQLNNIKHSDKIYKLLQLLAYQIGSLVSIHEIANTLGINQETVNHYIDLLEKGFVIQRLSGLSNNPRKEISKMDKFYFVDVGIRNAIINNFNAIELRNDKGALWENFIYIERQKFLSYNEIVTRNYFWRRYSGAEIDLVEQKDGVFNAFEFKWLNKNTKVPKSWAEDYPNYTYNVVDTENFKDFVI
jgi:predicted AAA+ superfamily ATPase